MEDPYLHHPPPPAHGRTAGFLIAVPFVVCFSLFGVLNLVGGTALTVMSCRSERETKALASLHKIVRNFRIDEHIDPMRVVGIMLLVTGSLLVVIGLALGVTACRSVGEHERKRRRRQLQTSSTLPLYSLVDRRRTSASLTSFGPPPPPVNARCGKKRSLEKTVSPILEEPSGEYESLECERLAVEIHSISDTLSRNTSPCLQVFNRSEKLTKSQEMVPKDSTNALCKGMLPSIFAEVVCHPGKSEDIELAALSKSTESCQETTTEDSTNNSNSHKVFLKHSSTLTKVFSSSGYHASQQTKDVCESKLLEHLVLHSKTVPYKETLSEEGSNTEVLDSSINVSNVVDGSSIQATESVHQPETTTDPIFQSANFAGHEDTTPGWFNASLVTSNNSKIEASNSQVGSSNNSVIHVHSIEENLSRPNLDSSLSRFYFNGGDTQPFVSSDRTEVNIGCEEANNFTSWDSNNHSKDS
ncbi:hypothetical protein JTE90_017880 [Oedothorax gibbosus]|uniref:Uncharacterized protein n=1 Tax=Oedothorax gibbosus TaxID=931172 RepID=A0AAV6V409_9ARAC|nr:hypothetical protein JTE90_017880 [Oedothorax gibbosus]